MDDKIRLSFGLIALACSLTWKREKALATIETCGDLAAETICFLGEDKLSLVSNELAYIIDTALFDERPYTKLSLIHCSALRALRIIDGVSK